MPRLLRRKGERYVPARWRPSVAESASDSASSRCSSEPCRSFLKPVSDEILGVALPALAASMGIRSVLLGLGNDLAGGYALPMAIVAGMMTVGFIGSLILPAYRTSTAPASRTIPHVSDGSS